MSLSSDKLIPLLEEYAITQDKPAFIKKLLPGTDEHTFFYFTDVIRRGTDLQGQDLKKYKELIEQDSQGFKKALKFRNLLNQLESSDSDENTQKICLKINKLHFQLQHKHTRPKIAAGMTVENTEAQKDLSKIDQTIFDPILAVQTALKEKSVEGLMSISPIIYNQNTELFKQALDVILDNQYERSKFVKFLENKEPFDGIENYIIKYCTKPKEKFDEALCEFDSLFENRYPLSLFQKIVDHDQNVLSHINNFKRLFTAQIYPYVFSDKLQKHQDLALLLRHLYGWFTNEFPKKDQFVNFERTLIFYIVIIEDKFEKFDPELFETLVKNPPSIIYRLYETQAKLKRVDDYEDYSFLRSLAGLNQSYDEKFLVEIFSKYYSKIDLKAFNNVLKPGFTRKVVAEARLKNGETVEKASELLTKTELTDLNEEKFMRFSGHPQNNYLPSDEVVLKLELKNVKRILVKVFWVNTLQYYIEKEKQIDQNMLLDGLIAAEEISKVYDHASIKVFTEEFKFDSISNASRGIWVVEFMADGISSRAVIKKGQLSISQEDKEQGMQLMIYNEQGQVLKGKETGLYFNKKYYPTDEQGAIFIPANDDHAVSGILILKHEQFSQFGQPITLQESQVDFRADLIFNEETLLPGNTAEFALFTSVSSHYLPKLSTQKYISNCTCNVEFKKENGFQSSEIIENIAFKDGEDSKFSLFIPPKTEQVNFTMTFTLNRTKNPSEQKSFKISFINNKANYIKEHSFLRQDVKTGNYILYCLGKNGEPLVNQMVDLYFDTTWKSSYLQTSAQSDSQGLINLGALNNVTRLGLGLQGINLKTSFVVNNEFDINGKSRQERNLIRKEGEKFETDLSMRQAKENMLKLYFWSGSIDDCGKGLQDVSSQIKVSNQRAIVESLKSGIYYFYNLLEQNDGVVITVKNFQKQGDNIYFDNNKMYIQNQQLMPSFANVDASSNKSLKLKINNASKDTRVHIIASTFRDEGANYEQLVQGTTVAVAKFYEFERVQQSCHYMEDKAMGDEVVYVMERRRKEKGTGITCQKPAIFSVREEVGPTTFEPETVKQGAATFQAKESGYKKNDCLSDMLGNTKSRLKGKKSKAHSESGRAKFPQNNFSISYTNSYNCRHFTKLRHFLNTPCIQNFNLRPNQNGEIDFNTEGLQGKCLRIFLVDGSVRRSTEVFIKNSELAEDKLMKMNDLTMQSSRDKSKCVAYQRNVEVHGEAEEVEVPNFGTSDFEFVDSIASIMKLQKEFAGGDYYTQWEFLRKWGDLDLNSKLEHYDKFASHELNFFIYNKDKDFFDLIVADLIKGKTTKDVVDYFLLQDIPNLQRYLSAEYIHTLNVFEQVLLIYALRDHNKSVCEQLVQRLEGQDKMNDYNSVSNNFNTFFDKILNAKSMEDQVLVFQNKKAKKTLKAKIIRNQMDDISESEGSLDFQNNEDLFQNVQQEQMQMRRPRPMRMNMEEDDSDCYEDEDECEDDEYEGGGGGGGGGGDFSLGRKKGQPQTYANFKQNTDMAKDTKEYIERKYYGEVETDSQFIKLNKFWVDLAKHLLMTPEEPFVSQNFVYANNNLCEKVAVLSFIDLEFVSGKHEYIQKQQKHFFKLANPAMFFIKDLTEIDAKEGANDTLAAQRWFDVEQRYEYIQEENKEREKEIKQFMKGRVYGAQVVITNVTSIPQEIQAISEIPQGAIPVKTLDYVQAQSITLAAFSTKTYEFYFYFPNAGEFSFFPASVTRSGMRVPVSVATKGNLTVLSEQPKKEKLETIGDILAQGSREDIIQFLKTKAISNEKVFDCSQILWILKDKEFYNQVIRILRERLYFDQAVWGYGLLHGDKQAVQELINQEQLLEGMATQNLPINFYKGTSINVDVSRLAEYYPLSNNRFHSLHKSKCNILNQEFKGVYLQFLQYLLEKEGNWNFRDILSMAYYLLLQDRTDEAISFIKQNEQITEGKESYIVQYDYMRAYFDFYQGGPKYQVAREICEKYLSHPIISWRNRFFEMTNALADYDGDLNSGPLNIADQKANISSDTFLESKLSGAAIQFTFQNIGEAKVEYFFIDLEMLFSTSPFLSDKFEQLSVVQPNYTMIFQLDKSSQMDKHNIEIPKDLLNKNMVIRVSSGVLTQQMVYSSTSLAVQVVEKEGMIKVLSKELKPLAQVYVKCFAQMKSGSTIVFFKDGYTDMRGNFNYALVSSSEITKVKKFSILVVSEEHGNLIKECEPPLVSVQAAGHVEIQSRNWQQKQISAQQDRWGGMQSYKISKKAKWSKK